jgi:peptidyl-prolyl cis-trans isomerase SurA
MKDYCKTMRPKIRPITLLWLVALLVVAWPQIHAEVSELDSIVAVVNDDVILRSELEEQIGALLAQLGPADGQLPPRNVVEEQVLERLISDRLQLEAATQAGITVDDQTVARAVANIAKNNHLTLAELRDVMEADGISFSHFRDQIRQEILLARLRNQEVLSRIVVTDREVDSFLATEAAAATGRSAYHLYHILVSLPEGATPEEIQEARENAEQLVARVRAGEDFQHIALTRSDGRQALKGGDLGWRKASELPTIFTDVVVGMQRGDVSDPIRSASGFHIVLLDDFEGSDRQIVKQTRARHILIATSEITSDTEAQSRLQQLKARIDAGDDFADLARSHSDDKGSAIKGGDLGWVSSGDLVPRFEEKMNELSIGETSEPFRTEFGWHIVQVLERRDYDNTDDVLRSRAREAIRDRKAVEATELWLRRLRDEAYVEIRLEGYTP